MKPFDLKAALAGAPVVTVSGEPVTGLYWFGQASKTRFKVAGIFGGAVFIWTEDGCHYSDGPSHLDLRMAED